ncbi:MAG TPA: citrate synthase [Actinomycetota bacterium]|nr:citrate synthase [Actinomycetota bacterium]
MPDVVVRDLLTPDPVTVRPADPIGVAANAMRARGVGSALVTDDGRLVGIITERDMVLSTAGGARPDTSTVAAWMTPDPVTVSAGTSADVALDLLSQKGFRHLPVVDDGKLAGIVSLRDLVAGLRVTRVDPTRPSTAKGLENVVVGETRKSFIDGERGRLVYVGRDAVELALNHPFEAVWFLLMEERLPTATELEGFTEDLARRRALGDDEARLAATAGVGAPMSGLRSAASALAARWGFAPWLEADPDRPRQDALTLAAVFPAIAAAVSGHAETIPSLGEDGHVAAYVKAVTGGGADERQVTAMNRYFSLTADHGMNASTFTARVIASTGADVGGAVAGAIGALSGPLHGGAPSLVLDMLDEIGSVDRARDWLAERVRAGHRLMGFGHRVYRTDDPRALALRRTAQELGGGRTELALAVEDAAHEVLRELKPGRPIYTNVEFYSAVVFELAGIPRPMATVTFACSRVVGWIAHVLEQIADNRLIRPTATYLGEMPDYRD